MTTLSAKADSFSDQSGIALEVRRPRPGLERASENVPRGVLVSVQGQSAIRACVPALGQRLVHDDATPAAFLGCPARIHGHDFRAGSFGLAAENVHEVGPAGIGDRTSERVILEHVGHAQAFHSDQAVQPDEKQSGLVVVLVPQVANAGVQNADSVRCLSAVAAATILARDRTLQPAKLGKLGLLVSRVLDAVAVAGREESFQPHVDAYGGQRARRHGNVAKIAGQDHEPLVGLALEGDRLDRAFDGAVDFRTDRSDVLNAQALPLSPEGDSPRAEV